MKILRCILYCVVFAIAVCEEEKDVVLHTMTHAFEQFEEIRGQEGSRIKDGFIRLALAEKDDARLKDKLLNILDEMSEDASEDLKMQIKLFKDSVTVLSPKDFKEVMEHIAENRNLNSKRIKREVEKMPATKGKMDVTVTPGSLDEQNTTSDGNASFSTGVEMTTSNNTLSDVTLVL